MSERAQKNQAWARNLSDEDLDKEWHQCTADAHSLAWDQDDDVTRREDSKQRNEVEVHKSKCKALKDEVLRRKKDRAHSLQHCWPKVDRAFRP